MLTYPIQAMSNATVEHLFSLGVTVPEDVPVIVLAAAADRTRAIGLVVGTHITFAMNDLSLLHDRSGS
jgi:hypothetical protein